MKVLLLGINARFTHVNMALYYLRQYIDPQKHDVVILEKTINDNIWDIFSEIYDIFPDVLCLSSFIWNQDHIQTILREIKKVLPDMIIVCGGPDISWNHDAWLAEFPSIDFIICGAGEKAFFELQENDFWKQNINRIEKTIKTTNYHFSKIETPYQITDKTSLKNRYLYYEASRGCPFKCSYCLSSNLEQALEYKNIQQVKRDIEFLLSFEPIIIKFIDRSFNVNYELCQKLWEYISEIDTKTKFHFEIHPFFLTERQIQILSTMPKERIQLEIGIQTTNNDTLGLINREGTWEGVKHHLKKLSMLQNIHKHYDMIAGLPNETINDVEKSFNEIISLKPEQFQLGFLKILPGTEISNEIEKWGFKIQDKAPYKVFASKTLPYDAMCQIELVEMTLQLIYNSNIMNYFLKMCLFQTLGKDCIYKYFLSLGNHLKCKKINKSIKDKKKLFQYVKEHYDLLNIQSSLLSDCIIYDWFLLFKTQYYPDFLEASHCYLFKEEVYNRFKISWQKMHMSSNNKNIDDLYKKKLKNISFFKPESNEFRKLYLGNAVGAANIEDEGIYFIYYETSSKDFEILKQAVL